MVGGDLLVTVGVIGLVFAWAYVVESFKTRIATVSKRIVPNAARKFILDSTITRCQFEFLMLSSITLPLTQIFYPVEIRT